MDRTALITRQGWGPARDALLMACYPVAPSLDDLAEELGITMHALVERVKHLRAIGRKIGYRTANRQRRPPGTPPRQQDSPLPEVRGRPDCPLRHDHLPEVQGRDAAQHEHRPPGGWRAHPRTARPGADRGLRRPGRGWAGDLPPTRPQRGATVKVFYEPSAETLEVANSRSWVASYSGGKDSTSLVTWLEWLRRGGRIASTVLPRLVLSDTGVEYPFLRSITQRMMARLADCGWHCETVTPPIHQRLFPSIFGRGVPPVHPGMRKMRWCTNSTKIRPMALYSSTVGEAVVKLTGVRWGESDQRDGRLSLNGCVAGGECGLPEPGEGTYGPIITWRTCQVYDWLTGAVGAGVRSVLADLLPLTGELVQEYGFRVERDLFGFAEVSGLRFGCIGCPAVQRDKVIAAKAADASASWGALAGVYAIWAEMRLPRNRIGRERDGQVKLGPVRLSARQRLFGDLLRIQKASGVNLVNHQEEEFIRDCWKRQVYPRGWSVADEDFHL